MGDFLYVLLLDSSLMALGWWTICRLQHIHLPSLWSQNLKLFSFLNRQLHFPYTTKQICRASKKTNCTLRYEYNRGGGGIFYE